MPQVCSLHKVSANDFNSFLGQYKSSIVLDFQTLESLNSFDQDGVIIDTAWKDFANFFKSKDPIKINVGKIFEIKQLDNHGSALNIISPELVEEDVLMLSTYKLEDLIATLNKINKLERPKSELEPDRIFTTEEDIEYIAKNYKELYKYFHHAMQEKCGIVVKIN